MPLLKNSEKSKKIRISKFLLIPNKTWSMLLTVHEWVIFIRIGLQLFCTTLYSQFGIKMFTSGTLVTLLKLGAGYDHFHARLHSEPIWGIRPNSMLFFSRCQIFLNSNNHWNWPFWIRYGNKFIFYKQHFLLLFSLP